MYLPAIFFFLKNILSLSKIVTLNFAMYILTCSLKINVIGKVFDLWNSEFFELWTFFHKRN